MNDYLCTDKTLQHSTKSPRSYVFFPVFEIDFLFLDLLLQDSFCEDLSCWIFPMLVSLPFFAAVPPRPQFQCWSGFMGCRIYDVLSLSNFSLWFFRFCKFPVLASGFLRFGFWDLGCSSLGCLDLAFFWMEFDVFVFLVFGFFALGFFIGDLISIPCRSPPSPPNSMLLGMCEFSDARRFGLSGE